MRVCPESTCFRGYLFRGENAPVNTSGMIFFRLLHQTKIVDRGQWTVISEQWTEESCIVKKDCSKSENMVKYFQESERDEKANELHKGV